MKIICVAVAFCAGMAGAGPVALTESCAVDFSRTAGPIKPLHGVNRSPFRCNPEGRGTIPEFAEARIPYVRLHDVMGQFGGAHFVDVENIFPDMSKDENDPASYDFAFTDAYIRMLVDSGVKIFYRLGASIENYHAVKSYHVLPPKDPAKYARVCEHILMHYNEGWADGFRYGIEYWEVWNEPESDGMWQGTRRQLFDLYREIAVRFKRHPGVKIGGYGSIGFSFIDDPVASASQKDRVDWFLDFCKFVTAPETKCPVDFFTWHIYVNPGEKTERILNHAQFVRKTLDEHGLSGVESILGEWNTRLFGYDGMKDARGASFVASVFALLQQGPVDMALYYDGGVSYKYSGLFHFPSERTTHTYEAFRMWGELDRLGTSCAVSAPTNGVYLAAASNGAEKRILIVNAKETPETVVPAVRGVEDGAVFAVRQIDERHEAPASAGFYRPGGWRESVALPPWSVTLLSLGKR